MVDVVVAVLFIRKSVADMLAGASNLLQIRCFSVRLSDRSCISAINFSGYATYPAYYMMEYIIPCA
ncbi:MAG: hypothetical protein HDR28_06330 [Lachnospiraceae bacterium]|nr:hypothetical protein [Lachnospiraceae bacterium]